MDYKETKFKPFSTLDCAAEVKIYNSQVNRTYRVSLSSYIVGYAKSKGHRCYFASRDTKIIESINARFFKKCNNRGSLEVNNVVFEENIGLFLFELL